MLNTISEDHTIFFFFTATQFLKRKKESLSVNQPEALLDSREGLDHCLLPLPQRSRGHRVKDKSQEITAFGMGNHPASVMWVKYIKLN